MKTITTISKLRNIVAKLELANNTIIPETREKLIQVAIIQLNIEIDKLILLENKINNLL